MGVAAPATRTTWRWILWGLAAVACAIGLLAIVFLARNLMGDEPGPALYTESDLPEAPPDSHNGWAMLRDAQCARSDRLDRARQLVTEALDSELTATDFAEQRVIADDSLTEAIATCAKAFDAPRFADACPMDFEVQCPALAIFQCQRLLAYRALEAAAEGRGAEGVQVADRLLDGTLDYAQTARGLLGQMVAQHSLEDTLTLVEVLARWLSHDEVSPLLARLRAFDPDLLRPELALIGEYLRTLHAIDLVKSSTSGDLPGWLLDEGATRATIDAAYRRAAGGEVLDIPVQKQGLLWWFHNPVGKLLLDTLMQAGPVWDDLRARDEAIRDKRDALLRG